MKAFELAESWPVIGQLSQRPISRCLASQIFYLQCEFSFFTIILCRVWKQKTTLRMLTVVLIKTKKLLKNFPMPWFEGDQSPIPKHLVIGVIIIYIWRFTKVQTWILNKLVWYLIKVEIRQNYKFFRTLYCRGTVIKCADGNMYTTLFCHISYKFLELSLFWTAQKTC